MYVSNTPRQISPHHLSCWRGRGQRRRYLDLPFVNQEYNDPLNGHYFECHGGSWKDQIYATKETQTMGVVVNRANKNKEYRGRYILVEAGRSLDVDEEEQTMYRIDVSDIYD